jgi:hypothetical protein
MQMQLNARNRGAAGASALQTAIQLRHPNSKDRLKKAQLSFYLDPAVYQKLKLLSERSGVPQQVYLRRGLAHVLKSNAVPGFDASFTALHRRARDARQTHAKASERWGRLRLRWGELAADYRRRSALSAGAPRSRPR